MKVFEALQILKNEGPTFPKHGICSNAQDVCDRKMHLDNFQEYHACILVWLENSDNAFEDWQYFSGNCEYPIEGLPEVYRQNKPYRWDKRTKYGALRWELLDHLIEWFKKKDI